jgi:hypothetical protein
VGALQAGVLIGKGQFYATLYCMAQKISEGSFGSWPGVKNRYLGLQFVIKKGKKHFGWARLSVSRPPYVAALTGYAYETIPNKPIIAGKTQGPDDTSVEESNGTPAIPSPEPATLGALAMGAPGLSIWRREESALQGN